MRDGTAALIGSTRGKWGWQVRVCPEDVSILTPFKSVITALRMNPLLFATQRERERKKLKDTNLKKGSGLYLPHPPPRWASNRLLHVRISLLRRSAPPNSTICFKIRAHGRRVLTSGWQLYADSHLPGEALGDVTVSSDSSPLLVAVQRADNWKHGGAEVMQIPTIALSQSPSVS